MNGRQAAGWAAVALAAVCIAWLLLPAQTPQGARRSKLRVEPPRVVLPTHLRPAVPETPEAAGAETPGEQAVTGLVAISGEGWVRCSLPAELPRGPLESPFHFTHRQGPVLLGVADHESGYGLLRHEGRPVAGVRWQDAWPGEAGACTVEDVDEAEIRGVVRSELGPEPGVAIGGCGVTGVSDADGRYGLRVPVPQACTLQARGGPGTVAIPARLRLDQPVLRELELRFVREGLPEDALSQALQGSADGLQADVAREEAMLDPLQLLLADETLSSETRSVLERWADAEASRRQADVAEAARLAREAAATGGITPEP